MKQYLRRYYPIIVAGILLIVGLKIALASLSFAQHTNAEIKCRWHVGEYYPSAIYDDCVRSGATHLGYRVTAREFLRHIFSR